MQYNPQGAPNLDPAQAVGHVASIGALLAYWVGLLAPVAAFCASLMAIAWYVALFYDRAKKKQ